MGIGVAVIIGELHALQAAPSAPHVPPEAADTASALQPPQEPQQQQPGADPAEVQALTDQASSCFILLCLLLCLHLRQSTAGQVIGRIPRLSCTAFQLAAVHFALATRGS
jgi:hypothetical protein